MSQITTNKTQEHQQPEENKMGTMPVNRLLFSMSLPMIISMLVQAMYNIIDSIFVARISEDALTAVSLAFPIQALMIAVSSGTCVGVNAALSRSLGEGRQKEANLAATNGIFLTVLGFIVFGLMAFGSRMYFASQINNPAIVEYGTQYLSICLMFCFGLYMEMMLERLLQSTGRTIYSMFTQGLGAVINIILDPILIFGLFGVPALGIRGAAIATVTGQILAMLLAAFFNHRCNPEIQLSFKGFRPHGPTIKVIYIVGIPSIIMQSIVSVMTMGMNKILSSFSSTAVAVLGVYFKLQSFIFMPIFGLNNGMIPIIAYNYGAGKRKRIIDTTKLSIAIAMFIMFIGLIAFQFFPAELFLLFDASEDMLRIGVPALRIISISFLFAGYCIIIGSVFQALGNGFYSLVVSVARQLVCILPLAYLFAQLFQSTQYVWWAFPLAEIISVFLSTLLFKKTYDKKIKHLGS